MDYISAKEKFVQAWGALGTSWGVNRTMAQIHALLLVAEDPLSTNDIMEGLKISRGNVNMNIRALIDWGLVSKELKPGERKEFFIAEKDIWKVAARVMAERKRRELEPLKLIIAELQEFKPNKSEEQQVFGKTVRDINDLANLADKTLDRLSKAERNWMVNRFLKFVAKN